MKRRSGSIISEEKMKKISKASGQRESVAAEIIRQQ